MGNHLVDLTGQKFGTLTVLRRSDKDLPNGNKGRMRPAWVCQCECGKIVIRRGDDLKLGCHTTCGRCTPDKFGLIGKHIEHFDVLSAFLSKPTRGKIMYHCKCDCGQEFDAAGTDIKAGKVKSCGHLRRPIDLTGQKIGKLTVLRRDTGSKKNRYICKCDCGNELSVSYYDLRDKKRTDCGCVPKRRLGEIKDLTGMRFDRLLVLGLNDQVHISKCGAKQTLWNCQCDCGRKCVVKGEDLKSHKTRSCGCLYMERNKNVTRERYEQIKKQHRENDQAGIQRDISWQRFGRLVALYPIKTEKGKRTKWMCRCDCGNFKAVQLGNLINGWTKSCGCIDSQGQAEIATFLTKNNVHFKREFTFKDCRDKHPLPFDFCIFNDDNTPKFLIEYDGKQHFSPVRFNGMTEEDARKAFKIGCKHDQMKNEYCESHEIPLLRIKYTEYNNIKKIIKEFVKNKGWDL